MKYALTAPIPRVDRASKPAFSDGEPEPTCTKIYYASRTHSQLSQILPELRKLKLSCETRTHLKVSSPSEETISYGITLKRPNDEIESVDELSQPTWRTVSIGSRKQLCINDVLRSKGGDLDEKCRELLGGKWRIHFPHFVLDVASTRER